MFRLTYLLKSFHKILQVSALSVAFFVLGAVQGSGELEAASKSLRDDKSDRLTIELHGDNGLVHPFRVEVARTQKQQMRGLMFRKSLDDDAGMIFIYDRDDDIAMWMKNTYIPLDILFIDQAGIVRHIHENAKPHDLTPIASGGPVRAVLELKGGTASRLGLRVGSRLKGANLTLK